jgi:hypothetical protein
LRSIRPLAIERGSEAVGTQTNHGADERPERETEHRRVDQEQPIEMDEERIEHVRIDDVDEQTQPHQQPAHRSFRDEIGGHEQGWPDDQQIDDILADALRSP